jgi:hypothetical protein
MKNASTPQSAISLLLSAISEYQKGYRDFLLLNADR